MSKYTKDSALHKTNAESNKLTKQCIETAMLKLLKKKSINDISITELVKVAGVSRNAYYRNYDSKEEIVSEICRGITQRLLNSAEDWKASENKEEWMIKFFRYIGNNKTLFRIMIDAGLPITEIIESKILLTVEEPEARYAALAKNGMFVAVLKNWFNGGMKESPEMIGRMFNEFMIAIL